jgi:hypothetical protein
MAARNARYAFAFMHLRRPAQANGAILCFVAEAATTFESRSFGFGCGSSADHRALRLGTARQARAGHVKSARRRSPASFVSAGMRERDDRSQFSARPGSSAAFNISGLNAIVLERLRGTAARAKP